MFVFINIHSAAEPVFVINIVYISIVDIRFDISFAQSNGKHRGERDREKFILNFQAISDYK